MGEQDQREPFSRLEGFRIPCRITQETRGIDLLGGVRLVGRRIPERGLESARAIVVHEVDLGVTDASGCVAIS